MFTGEKQIDSLPAKASSTVSRLPNDTFRMLSDKLMEFQFNRPARPVYPPNYHQSIFQPPIYTQEKKYCLFEFADNSRC